MQFNWAKQRGVAIRGTKRRGEILVSSHATIKRGKCFSFDSISCDISAFVSFFFLFFVIWQTLMAGSSLLYVLLGILACRLKWCLPVKSISSLFRYWPLSASLKVWPLISPWTSSFRKGSLKDRSRAH